MYLHIPIAQPLRSSAGLRILAWSDRSLSQDFAFKWSLRVSVKLSITAHYLCLASLTVLESSKYNILTREAKSHSSLHWSEVCSGATMLACSQVSDWKDVCKKRSTVNIITSGHFQKNKTNQEHLLLHTKIKNKITKCAYLSSSLSKHKQ